MNNEPVAWMLVDEINGDYMLERYPSGDYDWIPLYTHPSNRISELEQQLKEEIQARAYALDDLNNRMMRFMKSYNEMASKLEEVGGAYTHPVKELTDEEIEEFEWMLKKHFNFHPTEIVPNLDRIIKAIARKAQEK